MTNGRRRDCSAVAAVALCALCGVGYGLATGAGARLPVAPQLAGTAREYGAIVARNELVCATLIALPHLVGGRVRWISVASDATAAVVVFPAAWLAAVIATHRGGLALMPHAPLELFAVALACSWTWRHGSVSPRWCATLQRLSLVGGLLLVAGAVEVFATPHAGFCPGVTGAQYRGTTAPPGDSPRCGLQAFENDGLIERARATSTFITRRGHATFDYERRGG
ncbi:MAG: hypothetical protein REI11_12645 [Patulibacter sp.]|nr:hypothetical protein [Patulibacter sp.]